MWHSIINLQGINVRICGFKTMQSPRVRQGLKHLRPYIQFTQLITGRYCSFSPPPMFVFFMGFLQRFLSPSLS